MDDMLIRARLTQPVSTGTPSIASARRQVASKEPTERLSFGEIMQKLQESEVSISKHAANRIESRNIELSESSLARLNEGIRIAKSKGLDDTLILVGDNAFIVSARNGTVITSMNDLQGRAITNIEGTVIV